MKLNNLRDLSIVLAAQQAEEAKAAKKAAEETKIMAQMEAMRKAREQKLAADRKAQMNHDWYLHN